LKGPKIGFINSAFNITGIKRISSYIKSCSRTQRVVADGKNLQQNKRVVAV
jgi:hypothetical protein